MRCGGGVPPAFFHPRKIASVCVGRVVRPERAWLCDSGNLFLREPQNRSETMPWFQFPYWWPC